MALNFEGNGLTITDIDDAGMFERKVPEVIHGIQAPEQRLIQDLILDFALDAHAA